MSFVFTIRIPVDAYKKYDIDRARFLEILENKAKQFIPEAEVQVIRTPLTPRKTKFVGAAEADSKNPIDKSFGQASAKERKNKKVK